MHAYNMVTGQVSVYAVLTSSIATPQRYLNTTDCAPYAVPRIPGTDSFPGG